MKVLLRNSTNFEDSLRGIGFGIGGPKQRPVKTLIKVLVASSLFLSSAVMVNAAPHDEITTTTHRHKNLFKVRAQKKFMGATVEVFIGNGDLLTAQNLQKRKVIIDFGDAKGGTYTIRLTKGNEMKEFHYIKK